MVEPELESWTVPTDPEKSGKFTAFDKNGKLVYKKEFNATERFNWDGNSMNSGILPPAIYIFIIEYSDGSTEQGNITLSY